MARVWERVCGSRRVIAVLASMLLVVTACGGGGGGASAAKTSNSAADSHASGGKSPTPTPVSEAKISTSIPSGAQGISVLDALTVKADKGTLTDVKLTNAQGGAVQGAFTSNNAEWRTSEVFGYSRTYNVTATAKDAKGVPTTLTSSFTTTTPANQTALTLSPNQRTVGVGQPIVATFDEPITDKAAAERTLSVKTMPAVEGAWHWFTSKEAHWRPKDYWKPGTNVTVQGNIYGKDLGNGLFGQADRSSSFTIGSSKIAIVDNNTHQMRVFFDGKKAHADIPVSLGRGGKVKINGKEIFFSTQSGVHVVLGKEQTRIMSSASFGIPEDNPLGYKEKIDLAVRITWGGEFVHAAAWSVRDQGVRNVSHGCINISPQNAKWFYDNFGPGDIVDVRNTDMKLPPTDGLGDWTLSWNQWVAGSALN